MPNDGIIYSVFTKPWKDLEINELCKLVKGFGFDGIEFPLRPGYQVEPEDAEKGLPRLVKQLGEHDLVITSVASVTEENIFAGCASAGIPIIRRMAYIDLKDGYFPAIEQMKRELDKTVPLCEKYNVKVGIQLHFMSGASNSMELRNIVNGYDPRYIAAIWDSAHSALAGEEPEQGLDILWPHLCMVNLKNAFYKPVTGPDAETLKWGYYFSSAKRGMASWPRISKYLKSRSYRGVLCLTAEYSEKELVNRLIREDIDYAKTLFN
jgi:sugar phosphate isomerase/epimerase